MSDIKTYGTGAQRSHIEERWSLLPMDSLMAAARVMSRGAERHGEDNWRKGIPIKDVLDHAMNHIAKYLLGDRSEEHLAHALCNLCMAVHFDGQHQKEIEDGSGSKCMHVFGKPCCGREDACRR